MDFFFQFWDGEGVYFVELLCSMRFLSSILYFSFLFLVLQEFQYL